LARNLTAPERETVILMNDEDEFAEITTHQRAILTKLRKNPAAEEIEDVSFGSSPGATFRIPANLISIRSKSRKGTGAGNVEALDKARRLRQGIDLKVERRVA
jgi:hypothetical protein